MENSAMNCECARIEALEGAAASDYAESHLKVVKIDSVAWTTEYVCPDTGTRWLLDYPDSELHGGGSPRLRKIQD
jgi:hypothetical protein